MLAATSAFADSVVLPVPSESWSVQFQGPTLQDTKSQADASGYAYAGNAGKVNVSLFVEPPSCPGGESNGARYQCFTAQIARSPLVVPSTIAGNEIAAGVLVMYMVRTAFDGRSILAFNAHLLFTHAGKAGDFHASVVQPESDDVRSLIELVQSVRIADR